MAKPGIQSIPWIPLRCSQVVNGRELAEHVAIEGPMRESVARSIFLQVSHEGV